MIIYGMLALILGTITRITESRLSAREKKERTIGWSESAWIIGGWALLLYGSLMLIWGVFDL